MRNLHISYGFDQNTPETNLSKTHKKTQNTCNKSAFSCTWITATTAIILSFTYIRGEEKSSTKHIQMDTKNKFKKKNVPWRVRFFLTLRYRSWAGGVTATTHVTRENLSAFRRVLRELLQVNISLLERQTPQKSSHAPIHTKGSL